MKKYLLLVWIFIYANCECQVVTGALRQRTFGGTTFLYFIPTSANRSTLHYFYLNSSVDSTGKDSTYAVQKFSLGKKIVGGWNGYQQVANGDSAAFSCTILISDPTNKTNIENVIQFVQDSFPKICMDSSRHFQNIMYSYGIGANYLLTYMLNTGFLGSEKFDKCFRKDGFADIYSFNSNVTQWPNLTGMSSWFFVGGSNSGNYVMGYTSDPKDSVLKYNHSPFTQYTVVAGQNYSQTTHDSSLSNAGNDARSNIFRFWYNVYDGIDTTQQKIVVDSFMVLDGGGFWGHASYSTYYYYDSQGDPLHGDLTPDNTTGNTSIGGGIYYQDAPSNGIVYRNHITSVDFTRDTSTTMWNVTEAWVFISNLSNTADTIQVVLGDSTMSANFISNFRLSTTSTFNIITTGGCNCWVRVWQGSVNSQHALVSFRRHSNGDETPVTGIVFYGHPLPGLGINTYQYDATYALSSDTFHQDIRYLEGGNFYNNYDTAYMTPMHHRNGINTIFKGNNDSTVIQPQQNPSSRNYTDSLIKLNYPIVHQYYSIQGPVTKVFNQTSDFLQRPVDSIGADWRLSKSFFTIGKLSYGEAFFGGSNPSANNAYFKSSGGWIKANNTLYGVEWGNEPNGVTFTNYWQDPISIGAMMTMVIDGCNNQYAGYGAHQADPNFKVYVPATAGIDVRWQAFVMRYLQYYYHTAHPPADFFGFHSYPQAHKKGIGLTTNESIGNYVVNPSAQGYLQDKVAAIHMMNGYWHGLCPLTFSEEGADKQFARTLSANGQFDTSLAGIIQYGSFTPERSLAFYQVSCLMLNAFVPVKEAMIYAYPDFDAPNAQNIYHTFSASGWRYFYFHPITFVLDSIHTSEGWYYYQGISQSLWGYKFAQLLDSNSNGLFRLKFRNISNPTQVCYVVWNDNPNNSTINTSIPIGGVVGSVLKKQGQFTSFNLTSTPVIPSSGVLTLNGINSQHTLIFATETPATITDFLLLQRGRRWRVQ